MRKTASVFILLLLLSASFAVAQSRETGAITGKAVDEQGAPLPGVSLTLSGEKLMGTRTALSDAEGDFRFPALPRAPTASRPSCRASGRSSRRTSA